MIASGKTRFEEEAAPSILADRGSDSRNEYGIVWRVDLHSCPVFLLKGTEIMGNCRNDRKCALRMLIANRGFNLTAIAALALAALGNTACCRGKATSVGTARIIAVTRRLVQQTRRGTMNELAIETQSLHKHFGELRAVDDLDLHVPRGSIYGFLGRNGAGKTTTIRMLAGLARSTSGELKVLGRNPQTDRVRLLERTGFVIDKALFPSMTGHELVRFNRGFFPRWSDSLVNKYTNLLEIPINKRFQKLSTGNQTKLCILLALSQGAELLILDEPTAGLDPIVTDQLLHVLVDDFANEGRTLFLSSHHLSKIERLCDWVGIVDRGKLLLEATLDDVRANFRRVRAAGRNLEFAAHVDILSSRTEGNTTEYVVKFNSDGFAAHLRSQGATVVDVQAMNLGEVFLEVVGKGEANVHVEILA